MVLDEFCFSSGRFIALSPKCYIANCQSGKFKLGTKGLPHNIDVTMKDFKSCLEDGKAFRVNIQTLTKRGNQMSRVNTYKKGLNRVFTKFRVADDGITCTPLKKDGVLL